MRKIPVPNSQMPIVQVQVINEKSEQYTVTAGGGLHVEVEDDVIEAIVTSSDNAGNTCQHAWTRDRGVETLDTFLENKQLREKVAEFEKQRRTTKPRATKKSEEVQTSSDVSRTPAKD